MCKQFRHKAEIVGISPDNSNLHVADTWIIQKITFTFSKPYLFTKDAL